MSKTLADDLQRVYPKQRPEPRVKAEDVPTVCPACGAGPLHPDDVTRATRDCRCTFPCGSVDILVDHFQEYPFGPGEGMVRAGLYRRCACYEREIAQLKAGEGAGRE